MSQDQSMPHDDPQAVINFAIEKEQEAVDFYNGLAGKVRSDSIAEELRKMAQMEERHKERLQNLDVSSGEMLDPVPVKDLRISDYMVDREPSPEMSWQDILVIAMKREQAAMDLYADMANVVTDPTVKKLFESLAAEEKTHKFYFEAIYDDDIFQEN